MKLPSEQFSQVKRKGIILGFSVVIFAGTTLIVERDKLRSAFEDNFAIKKKEAASNKTTRDQYSEIPICE